MRRSTVFLSNPTGMGAPRPAATAWPWLAAALAAVAGLYLLACRDVLFSPGHIFQNWDQTFPPWPDAVRSYGDVSASTWIPHFEMGSPGIMSGMTLYFDLLVRHGLAWLGGGFLARWLNLAYFLIGGAGFWFLARRLGLSGPACLVTCLVSQFSPRAYSLVLSGHTESGFAYALTPWALLLADTALESAGPRRFTAACLASGMVLALACSTPFGITLAGTLLLLYLLAGAVVRSWRRATLALALILGTTLVLHLPWIAPLAAPSAGTGQIKYHQSSGDVHAEYVHKYREYSVAPRQALIGHTDNLGMGTEYAYPVEPPRDAWWKPSAYALLALALLGFLCPARRRLKWFAGLSLLAGFVLLTGAQTLPGAVLYEAVLAKVKVLFYFMARPTRWLLVYSAGLALLCGLGVQAVRDRTVWTAHRWPDRLAAALTAVALAAYLWPWWSGQLTIPKNRTTQTMSLTLQSLGEDERLLAEALARDPGLYRVSVFPTISSPTGDIPAPPTTSLTRNFGMMGKDSLVGPAFIGQGYGRFLLSLAHRRAPATDAYGRLLGLGAVQRVIWDKDQPYLSYMDYGWMPRTRRGSETLPDPRGVLARFFAAQADLVRDPGWSFGPVDTLDNRHALPRVRAAARADLAAGGMPLLASLAELDADVFDRRVLIYATDAGAPELESLGRARGGVVVHDDARPELLLPFLPGERWLAPLRPGATAPPGFARLTELWHHVLWFEGSPLNAQALWSQGPAELAVPLPGAGPHRLFARVAGLPGQHGLEVRLNGRLLAATASADPLDRGWRWLDLGRHELAGNASLRFLARGRGAVVSGVLAVPEAEFQAAEASLRRLFPPQAGSTVLAEAEACATDHAGVYAAVADIPLLAHLPGVTLETRGLRPEGLDGSGLGVLAAEGEQPGRADFRIDFPRPVAGFTLVSYPRLFGDRENPSFVEAQWSTDGRTYHPLYRIEGAADGAWEDVYGRRQETAVAAGASRLWLRFELRQAQLCSQGNPPNQPMTLSVTPAEPFPGAASQGQAVFLPARFAPKAAWPGPQRVRARLLSARGPAWVDLGLLTSDDAGVVTLALDGQGRLAPFSGGAAPDAPALACDLIELSGPATAEPSPPPPPVRAERLNPARYALAGPFPGGGLLVFAESFHPAWRASAPGVELRPIKAYGSQNAFVLPEAAPDRLELVFAPQRWREAAQTAVGLAWIVLGLGVAALAVWPEKGGRA